MKVAAAAGRLGPGNDLEEQGVRQAENWAEDVRTCCPVLLQQLETYRHGYGYKPQAGRQLTRGVVVYGSQASLLQGMISARWSRVATLLD